MTSHSFKIKKPYQGSAIPQTQQQDQYSPPQFIKEYEAAKFRYIEDQYTKQSNQFIKGIASDKAAQELASKYPLFKILRYIVKMFLFNELEILFFAYILKQNNWKIHDSKIKSSAQTLKDIINNQMNDSENNKDSFAANNAYSFDSENFMEYKQVQLYLILNGYAVKYYLNDTDKIIIFEKYFSNIILDFQCLFTQWSSQYATTSLKINPKLLNSLFIDISDSDSQQHPGKKQQQASVKHDYNLLVDNLLSISTSYSNSSVNINNTYQFSNNNIGNNNHASNNNNNIMSNNCYGHGINGDGNGNNQDSKDKKNNDPNTYETANKKKKKKNQLDVKNEQKEQISEFSHILAQSIKKQQKILQKEQKQINFIDPLQKSQEQQKQQQGNFEGEGQAISQYQQWQENQQKNYQGRDTLTGDYINQNQINLFQNQGMIVSDHNQIIEQLRSQQQSLPQFQLSEQQQQQQQPFQQQQQQELQQQKIIMNNQGDKLNFSQQQNLNNLFNQDPLFTIGTPQLSFYPQNSYNLISSDFLNQSYFQQAMQSPQHQQPQQQQFSQQLSYFNGSNNFLTSSIEQLPQAFMQQQFQQKEYEQQKYQTDEQKADEIETQLNSIPFSN